MTIRLRPHHLLCILTYVGKGYSPAFTANYDRIAERIGGGEDIEIVTGPDDICTPLMDEPEPHCLRESVVERDANAAREIGTLLGTRITEGTTLILSPQTLRNLRRAFAEGQTRAACTGCNWADLCDGIAGNGFRGARL
ncbi:DUF1284 domain-containing protein [Pelagibacterium xiamenense]|uniref:DUF1284 domain-containing protein n=1 Tax=Pelagibacterium xiamenense TaxID=2901140 RepID=UPI001E29DCA7|nr:DUF1284 domain-containing protein [Pelagibacterium xiamenense]MCD7060470.1 DUF1284 domain-containing protein [Pelagibacterium xiamenense]